MAGRRAKGSIGPFADGKARRVDPAINAFVAANGGNLIAEYSSVPTIEEKVTKKIRSCGALAPEAPFPRRNRPHNIPTNPPTIHFICVRAA
jgi:hypothetical protein